MTVHTITQEEIEAARSTKKFNRRYPGVVSPGQYAWNEEAHRYERIDVSSSSESPYDFSASGLGIGSLGSHIERPATPTAAQIRHEAIRTIVRCKRCRKTYYDGAMFTTDFGSGLCDDCY